MSHKVLLVIGAICCAAIFAGILLAMFGCETEALRLSVGAFVLVVTLVLIYVFRGKP